MALTAVSNVTGTHSNRLLQGLSRLLPAAALVILFLLHATRTIALLGGPNGLLSAAPLIEGDYSLHGYYCLVKAGARSGRLWGYDPYFMAGYPKTAAFPTSSVYYELFTGLLPGHLKWTGLKFSVLVAALLPAIAVPAAAWLVAGRGCGLVAMLLVLAGFWFRQPDEFLRVGLASWLAGAALAVAAIAASAKLLSSRSNPLVYAPVTLLLATAACYAHLLTVVLLTIAAVGLTLAALWRRALSRLLVCVCVALGVVLLSAPLWYPAVRVVRWVQQSGVFYVSATPWQDLATLLLADSSSEWLVVFLACLTPWIVRGCDRAVLGPLLVAGLVSLLFSLIGSALPVTQGLQPVRFRSPSLWLLALPAAATARALAVSWARSQPHLRVAATAVAALGVRILLPDLLPLASPAPPLAQGLTPEQRQLVQWIRQNTTADARLLVEDISGLDSLHTQYPELYRSAAIVVLRQRVGPLLPVLTGRVCYGGLYYPAYLAHAQNKCGNGRLFGKLAWTERGAGYSRAELSKLLRQYNIGWAVVWSPPVRRLLRAYPDLCRLAATIGPFELYEFRRAGSFCLRGRATVRFRWNEIELIEPEPDARGQIVLSMHWDPGLKLEAPTAGKVVVESYAVPGDPVPFVRLRFDGPAPERIVLRWRAW